MASKKKNSKVPGFIIGPLLVIASVSALWKNETRFDYHKAAKETVPVAVLDQVKENQKLSYSGEMDQSLALPGKYIQTFTGYLIVHRSAEIYCWERDEDEDGDVTWSKQWMSSVEGNSRNDGIRQKLNSGRILPPSYKVGDLEVVSEKIEFVDSRVNVLPGPLPKTEEGSELGVDDTYLTLRKGQPENLGDERVSYRAIPVPPSATWFGKFSGGEGIADTAEVRSGMINSLIKDTGVLHHLVAGEREIALQTMKKHIERLKWIVRGIGTGTTVFGLIFFFSSFLRFLYPIPVIGRIAETGTFVISLLLGIPLAATTIILGFVAGNPLLLIPIGVILLVGFLFVVHLGKKQKKKGENLKQQLDSEYGHALKPEELQKMEYREMAGLLTSRGQGIGEVESQALNQFAKTNGIESEERESLLEEVRENPPPFETAEYHLRNIIRMSVADGRLTPKEIRSIREAAELAGYSREEFRKLMIDVGEMAENQKAS